MIRILNKIIAVLMTICIVFYPARSAFPGELNIVVESNNAIVNNETPGATTVTATDTDPIILSYLDAGLDLAMGESIIFYVLTSDASILNKDLTGSPSSILGTIKCLDMDGNTVSTFVIYNPQGVHFGPTANINVGSLIVSALHISVEDFMSGNYTFQKLSDEAAQILNEGRLIAANKGFIALLADSVKNEGYISAEQGSIVLASGSKMTLAFDNDGLIQVAINEATRTKLNTVEDAIINTGTLQADGGIVLIKVNTVKDLFRNAVNNDGVIQATRVIEGKNGSIEIIAEGGDIALSGGYLMADHTTLSADKVRLPGTDPYTFYGDMTIHNFECLTPGKEIYFEAGKTYTFKDTLDIGPHSKNLPVYMQSTDPGSLWYIDIDIEDYSVQRVAVSDSYNLSDTTIYATPSFNWGNNTGWELNTVYWAGGGSNWSNPGSWDPEGSPAGQDVYFSSAYDPSYTTSYIDSSYYINSLTIDSSWPGYIYQSGGDLHISGNFTQDNGYFDAGSYNYTTYFDGSSDYQYINGYSSQTTFNHVYMDNSSYTIYLSDDLYVKGNFTLNQGSFDASSYITYFEGSSNFQYIDGGSSADFDHMYFNNSMYTIYLSDDLYVAGNFTLNSGYFDANGYTTYFQPNSNNQYVDAGSNASFDHVIVNGSMYTTYLSDDLYLGGNFTDNSGYFDGSDYTVKFDGSNYTSQYIDGSSSTRFGHIDISTSSYYVYLYDDLYVQGNFTLNSGYFDAMGYTTYFEGSSNYQYIDGGSNADFDHMYFNNPSYTIYLYDDLYVAGNFTLNSGSFDAMGYTTYFQPNSVNQYVDAGSSATFDHVVFNSSNGYYTYLSDDLYVSGNFTDNSGYFNGTGYDIHLDGSNSVNQYINGQTGGIFGGIYCDTSSYTVYLSDDIRIAGNLTLNSGSFNEMNYTVTFYPTAANQYIVGLSGVTFDEVTFNSSGGYSTYLSCDLHLDGNFTDNAGYFDGTGYTVYFDGGNAASQYIDGGAAGTTFGNIDFNNNSYYVYLSDDIYVKGDFTLSAGNFSAQSMYTTYFNGASGQAINVNANASFYDVEFGNSAVTWTLGGAFNVGRNLTVTNGILDVGNDNAITLSAGGLLSLSNGTITGSSNNVDITAPTITYTTGNITTTGSGNITLNGAGVFTLGNISSVGTINIGQITAPSSIVQSNATTISGTTLTATSANAITFAQSTNDVNTINLTSGNNQNIAFTDVDAVDVELANAGSGDISITAGGNVTDSGAITADKLTANTSGAASLGAITLNTATTDVNTINFTSGNNQDITFVDVDGVAVELANAGTGDVALTSGGAITESGVGVDVVASVLTADAQTGIDLDTTVTSLDLSTAAAGDITIDETNAITITDITCANGDIQVTNATGDMNLLVTTAVSNTVTLEATTGAITNGNGAGTNVTSSTLVITAQNDIGSAVSPLTADITTLTATSTGGGNIYINVVGDVVIVDNVDQDYTYDLFVNKTVDIRNLTVTGAGNEVNITTSFGNIIVENITCGGPVNLTAQSGSMIDNSSNIRGTQGNFSFSGIIGTRANPINISMNSLVLTVLDQQDGFSGVLNGSAGSISTNDAPGLILMNGGIVHIPSVVNNILGTYKSVLYEDNRYEPSNPVLEFLRNLENTVSASYTYDLVSPYIDTNEYVLENLYEFGEGPYLQ